MCSNLKDWQKKLTEYFSKQEGQNYPCSNQVVVCGFIALYRSDWERFVHDNKDKIARQYRNTMGEEILLNNNERWVWIAPSRGSIRGYRFYKVLADKNINKKIIEETSENNEEHDEEVNTYDGTNI